MYALVQRCSEGDVLALKDLWVLMFDEPFDPTRPVEDITADITEKFNSVAAAEESAQPEPVDGVIAALEAIERFATLFNKVVSTSRPPKK